MPNLFYNGFVLFLFSIVSQKFLDSIGKILGAHFTPIEFVFWRNLLSAIVFFIVFSLINKTYLMKTKNFWSQLLRASIGTLSYILVIWSIHLVPLSVASAFFLLSPIMVTIFSTIFLREHIGFYKILSVFFGFIGALIIANPWHVSDNIISLKAILVIFCAICITSTVPITLRWIGSKEAAATTSFYFMFLGTFILLPILPFLPNIPASETHLDSNFSLLMIGLTAILAPLTMFCKTESYRLEEASKLAPLLYLIPVIAAFFDYVIWQYIPTLNVIIGTAIIITGNAFILWREQGKAQKT